MSRVGIIGAGSWGTALSLVLANNGHSVEIWSIVENEIEMLKEKHEHIDKLPGVKLPDSITFTTDIEETIKNNDILVLAVPSVFTRSTAVKMAPFVKKGQIIVCVAKGIEENTLMTISDVVESEIPCADVAVMCGPSHAEEVGQLLPTTVVAGGTEASICPVGIAGFENMKALCTSTDKNRASIPFDKERSGFVMGEGSGILVLEELEHAKKRNAKIYAEVIGFGSTSDAYHITSPCPDGEGGANAMVRAIKDAKIKPEDIDYINAHGTSTHLNDLTETMAIKTALGESSKKVMISSTKGNIGHLLGAAGAVEAIFCVKAMENGLVPPTINYKEKDEECDLDIVPNEPRKTKLNIVMSNSLGFGGHNSSIILKKWEEK